MFAASEKMMNGVFGVFSLKFGTVCFDAAEKKPSKIVFLSRLSLGIFVINRVD